jgi:hypothetical protein
MDPGSIALSIPIVAIVCASLVKISHVRARESRGSLASDVTDRLNALETEVVDLRRELGEAHERLDFTERLLAQKKDPRLSGQP